MIQCDESNPIPIVQAGIYRPCLEYCKYECITDKLVHLWMPLGDHITQ